MTTTVSSMPRSKRKEVKRFAKFLFVGATGFVVDFGLFNLLIRALGFPALLAQAISFTSAAINNFMWNRYWTYPDSRSKPILRQFAQFFVLSLIGLLIRTPIFGVLSGPAKAVAESLQYGPFAGLMTFATGTLHLTIEQIGYNAALAGAVLVVLFWNFFSNRFITYGDVKLGH